MNKPLFATSLMSSDDSLGFDDPIVRAVLAEHPGWSVEQAAEYLQRLDAAAARDGFFEPLDDNFSRDADDPEADDSDTGDGAGAATPRAFASSFLVDESASLGPGDAIGHYRIVRLAGGGAHGRVFEAVENIADATRDRERSAGSRESGNMDGPVAIKVVRNRTFDAGDRLEIERLVLSSLDHPNLVSAISSGQLPGGTPYLVMDFIDGQPLDDYVAERHPSYLDIAALFVQLAKAMEYAHGQDVLHRDLKPSNILIKSDSVPIITDFGLAKRLNVTDESSLTATGAMIGTLGYLAPEQADTQRSEITRAADVYGLGATLYAILTGRAPLKSDNLLETLDAIRKRPPEKPCEIVPDIPLDLQTICLKCLEKEPASRYRSMGELADDLQRFMDGRRVAARGPRLDQRLMRWSRKNPWIAGLAFTSAASVLIGLVVSVTLWRQSRRWYDRSQEMVATARQILQTGDRFAETTLSATPEILAYRQERLRQSVQFFDALVELHPNDDELYMESAVAWFRLAKVCSLRAHYEEAYTAYSTALQRFQGVSLLHPEDHSIRFDIFHCMLGLHQANTELGEKELADGLLEEAWQTIQDLNTLAPEEHKYRDALAHTSLVVADSWINSKDFESAKRAAELAWEVATQLKAEIPEPHLFWLHTGTAALMLSHCHRAQGDYAAAENWLTIGTAETEACLSRPLEDPGELSVWAKVLWHWSQLEKVRGNSDASNAWLDTLFAFLDNCRRAFPDYVVFQDLVAYCASQCGRKLPETPVKLPVEDKPEIRLLKLGLISDEALVK